MRKMMQVTLLLAFLLLAAVGVVQAQDDDEDRRGTIQGLVYEDVNGDGRCVDTGVAGEEPVEGIDIEFVSSDEQTVITLYSGPDGIYGLYAAGHSYWAVTVKPSAEWVVTSERTIYVPIDNDNLVATGVNFCVQRGILAQVVLPASGAAARSQGLTLSALLGVGLVLVGLALGRRSWR